MVSTKFAIGVPAWVSRVTGGLKSALRVMLMLFLPHAAGAVSPDEPTLLSPLVVQAQRAPLPSPLATSTQLEASSPSLADLFRNVPGLIAQESFGGFDPPRLAVRGSGLQSAPSSRGLRLSLFGMPMNAADGSFNLALLESGWLDSVDLVRGTAAGVPALGGALEFGRNTWTPGKRLSGSCANDDTLALHACGAFSGESLTHVGRVAIFRSDGWRPHSQQERESLFGASRLQMDELTDLSILFLASNPWYEVPGPLTKSTALNTPTAEQSSIIRDRPRRETGHAQIEARATRQWTDGRVSMALGAAGSNDEFYQLQANGVSATDGADAYLSIHAEREWAMAKQRSGFSALLQSGWWDSRRYRNDKGDKGALIGDHRLQPLTLTAALDHRAELAEHHHLDIGVSVLTAKRDLQDHFAGTPGSVPLDLDFQGTRLAPRVAWSWDLARDTTLTASWSRSYEPPTYNDLIHTTGPMDARVLRTADLDWQQADSMELGIRGQSDRINWSTCIYHASWQNEFLRLANADGSTRGTVNADDTVHYGFETSVACEFYQRDACTLTATVTYNYNDARFDNDPVYGDLHIAGVPPHTAWLGLRADFSGGWFIAPGCEVRGGTTYADHANDLGYGSATLWSLEIGRRHPDGWSVSFGIRNLFDSKTIASTAGVLDRAASPETTAIFLPAAGRTVSLRFDHTW